MKEVVTFVADYPIDNRLNSFGDYHRLICVMTRQAETVSRAFYLESDRGLPRKKLDEEQAQYVLEVFFMQHSTRDYEKIP